MKSSKIDVLNNYILDNGTFSLDSPKERLSFCFDIVEIRFVRNSEIELLAMYGRDDKGAKTVILRVSENIQTSIRPNMNIVGWVKVINPNIAILDEIIETQTDLTFPVFQCVKCGYIMRDVKPKSDKDRLPCPKCSNIMKATDNIYINYIHPIFKDLPYTLRS